VASGGSCWQLQALVVAFTNYTWLGSLKGGRGRVNPQKDLHESESMVPAISIVVVVVAL